MKKLTTSIKLFLLCATVCLLAVVVLKNYETVSTTIRWLLHSKKYKEDVLANC